VFWEMRLRSAVDQEIRALIQKHGRMTFAQFMQACLYSPYGGFYSSRGTKISTHFGTSPTSHPVFGALIARQLEQMWHLLGDPPVFHVIEVGSGDGALAQAIVHACERMAPRLAQALYYVAADYEPRCLPSPDHTFDRDHGTGDGMSPATVSAEGAQSNVPPFPATAWAEGAQLNGRPSPARGEGAIPGLFSSRYFAGGTGLLDPFPPAWGKGLMALRRRSRAMAGMGGKRPSGLLRRSTPPPQPSPIVGGGSPTAGAGAEN
jgi:hypothetical protein